MRNTPTTPFSFRDRHIGPDPSERAAMLERVGYESIESLIDAVIPPHIRTKEPLDVPGPIDEHEALDTLRAMAERNTLLTPMIGLGYHRSHIPTVILRNVMENPAWYTAYTPYQPEISQGRLEALVNFQTMVSDLTGMEIANASLLDEATAAAEAMTMAKRSCRGNRNRFFVHSGCHPHTVGVVRTRAQPLGIELVEGNPLDVDDWSPYFGVLLAYPSTDGTLPRFGAVADAAREAGSVVAVVTDLLALCLLEAPGTWGADIVVGSAQRFGVPMGFGGPHAGFMATTAQYQRSLPGRLVGVSVDADGHPAYRLALQTREQHIRRDKATSNICTAQVLLAVMSAMYGTYHGPDGLRGIARSVHATATELARRVASHGIPVLNETWFDTVTLSVPGHAESVASAARERGINIRVIDSDTVSACADETTTATNVDDLVSALTSSVPAGAAAEVGTGIPDSLERSTGFMTHEVFNSHHSETSMLRYLRRLSDKDLALDRSMIPLGSCTMKLNATTEMIPVTWPGFADMHPFAPLDQAAGYLELFEQLEAWLTDICGYDATSLQPNAGSQGELAGLLAIAAYHRSRGDLNRTVCLIPSSAHGTNAASAVMAGMSVVVVSCDDTGNVDMDDLRIKIDSHAEKLSAIMVTYPSTHGVFEEGISALCTMVHDAGGQVYLDGANMNAMVGLARPGEFGADVSHLNLHKTFCIPHGGGGPGVGPVVVRAHLAPFLPSHDLVDPAAPGGVGQISSAPWGSASILPISWAYIAMMGPDGLEDATASAILSANYVARRLSVHFPILYSGRDGLVAHECIVDIRPLERECGITAEDVAKRLIDYGFHAPTMSFPVAGTLMIEPTESEGLLELDRFCEAMISIRGEIDSVASGEWSAEDSPLRHAPHTAQVVSADDWNRPYPRSLGAYPLASLRQQKYWSPVARVDNGYGDRNLQCSCPPPEAFEE